MAQSRLWHADHIIFYRMEEQKTASALSEYINEVGTWNTITASQMRHGVRTSVNNLKIIYDYNYQYI